MTSITRHPFQLVLLCLVLLLLAVTPAIAQERAAEAPRAGERETRLHDSRQQLENIHKALLDIRTRVEQLRQGLDRAEDNEQREMLQQQIEQLETQRRNLRTTFENIALGGIDVGVFAEQPDQEDFNWQDELLSIMRPLFSEMRQLTERPRYLSEARLFLDAGQVREGERVLYRGIPWRVGTIGFYARLVNPELDNGLLLLLPLAELAGLISRPTPEQEPWFPSRPGEYVLLADGTFALVERQTPEIVQARVMGNTVLYATTDFLAKNPRNLSRGSYVSAVVFDISYNHQAIATTAVPQVLHDGIAAALAASSVADHVEDVMVEFREAAASSLDFQIVVTINGKAAGSCFAVGRLIQKACVDVCNANDWVIPFNQLTVHQGEGFEALLAPMGPAAAAWAAPAQGGVLTRWLAPRG